MIHRGRPYHRVTLWSILHFDYIRSKHRPIINIIIGLLFKDIPNRGDLSFKFKHNIFIMLSIFLGLDFIYFGEHNIIFIKIWKNLFFI